MKDFKQLERKAKRYGDVGLVIFIISWILLAYLYFVVEKPELALIAVVGSLFGMALCGFQSGIIMAIEEIQEKNKE